MPSGFQQDNNQLSPGLFRVVWVANTGTYPTADGDDNGAITPNSSDSFATLPTTLIKGQARARGNMRFRNVINRLTGLADCQILDIETGISGGGVEVAGDNQVTSLAFTVKFDRDEGVVDAATKLNSYGSTFSATAVDGATAITTVALAIKDQFVRGFSDATTANVRVYNGTNDTQQSITVSSPDTAADIWADTTVALIDGTELITVDTASAAEK